MQFNKIPKLLIPEYLTFKRTFFSNKDESRFSLLRVFNLLFFCSIFFIVYLSSKSLFLDSLLSNQEAIILKISFFYILLIVLTTALNTVQLLFTFKNIDLYLMMPLSSKDLYFGFFFKTLKGSSKIIFIFGLPFIFGLISANQLNFLTSLLIFATYSLVTLFGSVLGFLCGKIFVITFKNKARFLILLLLAFALFLLINENNLLTGKDLLMNILNFKNSYFNFYLLSIFFISTVLIFTLSKKIFVSSLHALFYFQNNNLKDKYEFIYKFKKLFAKSFFIKSVIPSLNIINPITKAIAFKEHKLFTRDLLQSLNFVIFLFLFFIYLPEISIEKLKANGVVLDEKSFHIAEIFLNQFFSGVILVGLANRFAFPSFSLERENSIFFKFLPVNFKQVLRGKVFYWCMPFSLCALVMFLCSGFKTNSTIFELIFSLFIAFISTLTITTIATGLGAVFRKENWNSITEITGTYSSLLTMIICSFVMLLNCCGGLLLFSIEQLDASIFKDLFRMIGVFLIGGGNLGVMWSAELLLGRWSNQKIS